MSKVNEEIIEGASNNYEATEIVLPEFNNWNGNQLYNYSDLITDYSSFEEIEKVLVRARKALFVLNDKINEYERLEKISRKEYERQYRRAYLGTVEKTETARKARAELKCELLENEWMKHEQLKGELVRMSQTMKAEIQTLHTLAYNLRTQVKSL